jgi:hypothetical protein
VTGLWRRRLQHCLYLVGPPEDSLRLRLRHSLVPGRTHPCSGGGHRLRCLPLGQHLHGGVVVIIIVHLEWGPSSTPNIRSFWAEPNINTSTQIKCRAWVRVGLGRRNLVNSTPGTGDSKLATASPQRRVRRLIRPGAVEIAARRMSQ